MSDAKIPDKPHVTQSLQERWEAGRAFDEATERRLQAGSEAPEKKRLWELLKEMKRRVEELMSVFSRAQPADDAKLERRYGQGMTKDERAADAALLARAEQERLLAVAHLEEVVLLDQPRRPAGETPIHKAYSTHADKRAPAYEVAADAHEAVMWEAEAAAKELDPALRLTSETYNGRRVVRFTHTEFPEVTWLMPVEAMSQEAARDYLENSLHRTYNEKMAKIEAQAITLPLKPAPKPAKAPESPIMRVGAEEIGEAAEQAEDGDPRSMIEMEQRLELARNVREGRIPADDLEPGQEEWIRDLLDDAAFLKEERRLAMLKRQGAQHADGFGAPADTADQPTSPPEPDLPPPAPRIAPAPPETSDKKEADWRPIVEKAEKAYESAWAMIKAQITEMVRLDPASIERVRQMYEDAQAIDEQRILEELVAFKIIDRRDAEVMRGSAELDRLAGLYIKIYESALSEAERLVSKDAASAEAKPAPETKVEDTEQKRRIDVTNLAGEVDFLTRRWAFLASNGRPNTNVGRSIRALIDDMGGEATPAGQAFEAYVDAMADLHEKGYSGATVDEMKPFEEKARKAFVAFRNLVEPPRTARKSGGHGKRGPEPKARRSHNAFS